MDWNRNDEEIHPHTATEWSKNDDNMHHRIAQNLLGMREAVALKSDPQKLMRHHEITFQTGTVYTTTQHEDSKSYSVSKFYEPKFYEVFGAYEAFVSCFQDLDTTSSMMVMCLENIILFSCWARESPARMSWIRSTLNENNDLRPEVRNGLAMTLIYVLASAKAARSHDMFATLQDPILGLGIVNKTSLKIYNDPHNYFSFLKSCISGLIDAGAIPENERQNQPKKPWQSNGDRDELIAFFQLKSAMVDMLKRGHFEQFREGIRYILEGWQSRTTQNIRASRFSIALNLLSESGVLASTGTSTCVIDESCQQTIVALATPHNVFADTMVALTAVCVGGAGNAEGDQVGDIDASAAGAITTTSNVNGDGSNVEASQEGLRPVTQSSRSSRSGQSSKRKRDSSQVDVLTGSAHAHHDLNYAIRSTSELQRSVVEATGNGKGVTRDRDHRSAKTFPHRLSPNPSPNPSPSSSSCSSPSDMSLALLRPLRRPIQVIRFERVSLREWEFKHFQLHDWATFMRDPPSLLYMIDDRGIKDGERDLHKVTSLPGGFVSLPAEFHKRRMIVTSWNKHEYGQLTAMVNTWNERDDGSGSLLDLWRESPNTGNEYDMEQPGNGLLAYEVVLQVGLIVRGCESLGFSEDCWRFLYPKELHTEALMMSFGAFLASIFPQTRAIIATGVDLSSVIVKYHPHKVDAAVVQVPKRMGGESYQTIGTLDEMASTVISRLEATLSFYDFILQKIC